MAALEALLSGLIPRRFHRRHVWMAPLLQGFFGFDTRGGCSHVCGVWLSPRLDAICEPAPDHPGGVILRWRRRVFPVWPSL